MSLVDHNILVTKVRMSIRCVTDIFVCCCLLSTKMNLLVGGQNLRDGDIFDTYISKQGNMLFFKKHEINLEQ